MTFKQALPFLGAGLLLLNLIIPPFQNPDEPQHFAMAVIYARGAAGEGAGMEREAVESGVLRMMDRANWWRLVGIGQPQPLPARLSDIEFLMKDVAGEGDFRNRLTNFLLWHRLAGAAMRPVAGWRLEKLYFLGRAASALFLFGSFFLLWKTFEMLGTVFGKGARMGFSIAFFLPQFWLTGTSVSPDAFVALLGAAFFYAAAVLLFGKGRGDEKSHGNKGLGNVWPAILVVFLPVVGMLVDRSAFIMVPAALAVAALMIRRENWQTAVPMMLIGAIGAVLAAYFMALRYPFLAEQVYQSAKNVLSVGLKPLAGILDISGFARPFWGFTADGMLLKFGWLVFSVSKAVYWAWRILLIAAGAGLAVRLLKWAKARMNDEDRAGGESGRSPRARWMMLAAASVAVQALGMWAYYGTKGILGQGRYFFPVILPLAFLLAVGWHELGELMKRGAGRKLVAAVIAGEFLLFVFSIWIHIVPAFHLILRGPHPGV